MRHLPATPALSGKATSKDFAGVDPDLKAFAKFVERYLDRNSALELAHVLFGESYGTTRSAGLAAVLQEDGVQLNGIVLLSSVLNYLSSAGSRARPGCYLQPALLSSYRWYHKKVAGSTGESGPAMEAFVEQARVFARGEYAQALGRAITSRQAT